MKYVETEQEVKNMYDANGNNVYSEYQDFLNSISKDKKISYAEIDYEHE